MGDFVELGAEFTDRITEKHFDTVYDKVNDRIQKTTSQRRNQPDPSHPPRDRDSALTSASTRRHRNQLPSPERDPNYSASSDFHHDSIVRDLSPERSETSERVLRAYEAERDDPRRRPDPALSVSGRRGNRNMASYQPGGDSTGYAPRPRSQPPRSRYDDDGGDSDYDDREGRRYSKGSGGRGYRDDDDYDREVIETERYKGVSTALVVSTATRRPCLHAPADPIL